MQVRRAALNQGSDPRALGGGCPLSGGGLCHQRRAALHEHPRRHRLVRGDHRSRSSALGGRRRSGRRGLPGQCLGHIVYPEHRRWNLGSQPPQVLLQLPDQSARAPRAGARQAHLLELAELLLHLLYGSDQVATQRLSRAERPLPHAVLQLARGLGRLADQPLERGEDGAEIDAGIF